MCVCVSFTEKMERKGGEVRLGISRLKKKKKISEAL